MSKYKKEDTEYDGFNTKNKKKYKKKKLKKGKKRYPKKQSDYRKQARKKKW